MSTQIDLDTLRHGEKVWHERHFSSKSRNELVVPEKIRRRYINPPAGVPLFILEELFREVGDIRGEKVLAFGCGDSNSTVILALKGAEVWAFDLSEEAVAIQRRVAEANGVADRMHCLVCAAEQLPFADAQFDLIVGTAILHHIPSHLPGLPRELLRILKKNGRALFAEPVSRSKALQFVLAKLPGHQEISPGERVLAERDFDPFNEGFGITFCYFTLFSRLDRFLLNGPLEYARLGRKAAVYALHILDHFLLKVLCLERFAGLALISLRRTSA